MTTIPLSFRLLGIISIIQAHKNLVLHESMYGLTDDWVQKSKDYFHSLPDEVFKDLGLKKSITCHASILDFKITDEMNQAPHDKLHQIGRLVF